MPITTITIVIRPSSNRLPKLLGLYCKREVAFAKEPYMRVSIAKEPYMRVSIAKEPYMTVIRPSRRALMH